MKLICEGLDLSDAVMKVLKATALKTTNPILEGIKLKAINDRLILSATDLELSIEKTINADVKIEGEAVVPGKFFVDFVKKLSNEKIELTLGDNKLLKIKYTDSEGFIQCLNDEEFPILKTITSPEYFSIKKNDLRDIINETIFSAAIDDSRPILKGCKFEVSKDNLTVVAIDGFRLALVKKPIENVSAEMGFVVPARSLSEISKILDDSEDFVKIYVQRNYIMVDLIDTKIMTRLLDGDFINHQNVIPTSFDTVITINKRQLEDGLERASLLARLDKNNKVIFEIKDKLLTLTSTSDIGNIKENISISLQGKDLSIAFNAKYFSECTKNISDEFIKINFSSAIAPCTITSTENNEFLYLILPVRILK
ncbi:MAG: DNA polymerase III subunit beta [Clostridia bacterium]